MDDPEPKRGGGRAARRASVTHERLLRAALTIFNSQGFDGCAIEDITEEADVGKGTFYRHFRDKHAILASLVHAAIAELENKLAAATAHPATRREAVTAIVKSHSAVFRSHQNLFLLLLQGQGILAARKELYPELQQAFSRYWDLLDQQLAIAPPAGTPPATPTPAPRRLGAVITSGTILGFVTAALNILPPAEVVEKLEASCEALTTGITEHLRCAV